MVLMDPPWNIRIAGNVSGLGKVKHADFAMGVGEMTRGEFTTFLRTILMLSVTHLVDGALIYVFMDRKKLMELFTAAEDAKLKIIDLCIWNKQTGGMGGMYRSQYEPCLVLKHGDAPYLNNVQLGKYGRYRTNMWEHPGLSSFGKGRDKTLAMHPTVKPVALLAEAIKDCTKRGEVVLDPFSGSGSSIIAAEKTGRVGFGIELEPKYVDVTVRRGLARQLRAEQRQAADAVRAAEARQGRVVDVQCGMHGGLQCRSARSVSRRNSRPVSAHRRSLRFTRCAPASP